MQKCFYLSPKVWVWNVLCLIHGVMHRDGAIKKEPEEKKQIGILSGGTCSKVSSFNCFLPALCLPIWHRLEGKCGSSIELCYCNYACAYQQVSVFYMFNILSSMTTPTSRAIKKYLNRSGGLIVPQLCNLTILAVPGFWLFATMMLSVDKTNS